MSEPRNDREAHRELEDAHRRYNKPDRDFDATNFAFYMMVVCVLAIIGFIALVAGV